MAASHPSFPNLRPNRQIVRLFSFILASLISLGPVASSAPFFPERIQAFEQDFVKMGEYRFVYRMFFNLYEAALFTSPGATAEDVLNAETAFHLQFHYLRSIEKAIILKSARRMLEKNLSTEQQQQIAERVEQINAAYTSVNKGDRSSLTYQPGIGTTLVINNEPKLTLQGEDFAKLYFRIWLGPQPISNSMKAHLLGRD